MSKSENTILMSSVILCWASTYIFIKQLPASLPDFAYMTMNFGIAAILLTIIFWEKIREIKKTTILKSGLLGLILTANILFDKLGIDQLPSSLCSVFAASAILIVPAIMILLRKFPTKNNLAGAVIIMSGILLTNRFEVSNLFSAGAFFMLMSALLASIYTIVADKITKEEDPILLTMLQMWISALLSFFIWFGEDPMTFASIEYSNSMLSSIFICSFFGKAYAYVALMMAQKYSDPINITIISSTEPVVTLMLAVLIPSVFEEQFTWSAGLGAAIIMIGAIVSGTDFLTGKKKEILYETQ